MPDNTSSPTSPAPPRPKPARSVTAGTVRGRTSPSSGDQNGDARPPTKRARKAINCEPCRNSKLKCDRNRPCSSCVLRGTSAMCYQDARGHEGGDQVTRGDDHHYARIDPAQEIARLRHSISLLEAYVFPTQRTQLQQPHHRRGSEASSSLLPKQENIDNDVHDKGSVAPGMLGSHGQGVQFYAGPTSVPTHLLINENHESDEPESRQQSQDHVEEFQGMTQDYDRDLLALLPPLEVIDSLINFYFEYCNWIYRHVNHSAFTRQWERFKNGSSADRIVLSTACVIMAMAVYYLPANHSLLESFHENHEAVGCKFFEVSGTALQRRLAESRAYSLELVELLLIRCHFLTLRKTDSEEIWHVKGELVTIGMAMGLHRDPGKWRMHRDVAERRRWAWWHIVLLERWQAFMFGRPLAFASHHFDTQLPSYCNPSIDKTSRLYLPNIALFRLAYILGDIMDDAVSVRPIPYESVLANDRALTQWMDELPPELDLDEYRVARSLASDNISVRRLGVQSVIIRISYYHIRFTLHRPYVSGAANLSNSTGKEDSPKSSQSLEIAVSAADKVITMVTQSQPDFLANSSLAVPAHMSWGPFHCFSAAMFFSFQLISNPDQPGASLFRANIRKAMSTLEQSRGNSVADKAYDILQALAPLYSVDFPQETPEVREQKRVQVLGVVRKLAFPYHNSSDPRRYGDSPSSRGMAGSPSNSNSQSPPITMMQNLPAQYDHPQHDHSQHISSMRTPTSAYPPDQQIQSMPHSPHSQPQLVPVHQNMNGSSSSYLAQSYGMTQQHQVYTEASRYQYAHPVDEATVWGAAVGFGQGEWTQFLDGLRPDIPPSARHLQGS